MAPHFLLIIIHAFLISPAMGFVPGAVCNGVDVMAPAASLLRGKHLRVMELDWYPFAFKDSTAAQGWRGFDIDLLDEVASLLGFTYEVHEASQLPSETRWTETLIRTVNDVDLWASWWQRDQERMNHTVMLSGHIDASPTLVRPPLEAAGGGGNLLKSFTTFILPFSYPLWGCIILMVLLAGVVDFMIERKEGGKITTSLYEYCGGVLWGGFHDPLTRISAVYQIMNAFIILVIVSAYTANLASILVLARVPTPTFRSLDDLLSSRTSVCAVGSYPSQATFEATYPEMRFTKFAGHVPIAAGLNGLGATSCKAALIPRIDYDTWRTDGNNCGLGVVGPSLFLASAGWVTNMQGEQCVQRAVDYALHMLQVSGRYAAIFSKWLPFRGCGEAAPAAAQSGSSNPTGRRLQESSGGMGISGSARRLQESSGGDGSSSVEGQLELIDFFGLFAMWSVVTILTLIAWLISDWRQRGNNAPTKGVVIDVVCAAPAGFPEDVDISSTQAMLRHMVVEMNKLKANMPAADSHKKTAAESDSSYWLMDAIQRNHEQSSAKIAKVEEALQGLQAPFANGSSSISQRSGRHIRSRGSTRSSTSESAIPAQMASRHVQVVQKPNGTAEAGGPQANVLGVQLPEKTPVRRVQSFSCGTPVRHATSSA